jgi:predicted nucleotidyltransferase
MSSILIDFLKQQSDVSVAFLFGSRARGDAQASDWDIALIFNRRSSSKLDQLARLEQLRSGLSQTLACEADLIDLIDLQRAPLNLCISVAEEGQILTGHSSLELFRFYQRAWSAQEEFHFRKAHGL